MSLRPSIDEHRSGCVKCFVCAVCSMAVFTRRPIPYGLALPENWVPLDTQHEFELVPLNPDSMEFHLVSSEFLRTSKHTIKDIFRLQNIHLWNKFIWSALFLVSWLLVCFLYERILLVGMCFVRAQLVVGVLHERSWLSVCVLHERSSPSIR